MTLLDQIITRANSGLGYPVPNEHAEFESEHGHRDEFGPPEYGNYLATSNEIYSVANFRARQFGSLPLLGYDRRGSEKTEVTDGAEIDLLHKVNDHWTFARLMRQTELSMGVWGECPWAVNRDTSGTPREIWWLKSPNLHPIPDEDNWLKGFIYESHTGERIPFTPDEIVWFRYPNPIDQYAGLSPLAAARLAADVASASMQSNKKLFSQGMQLGGVITPATNKVSFSPEQVDDLERLLVRRFTGSDKAHRWAILRFEAAIQAMGVTPKDAEFSAGLSLTFRQVCRAFGVPPPLVFDHQDPTLANVREYQRIFWEHTGVPEANFYAYDLEEQLLPMFGRTRKVNHLAWDFTTIPALQEAATAVWERERQQIDVGGITINQWRKSKGMPDVPWGDVWWAPVNKAPVSGPDGPAADNQMNNDDSREAAARDMNQADLIASLVSAELADLAVSSNGHRD